MAKAYVSEFGSFISRFIKEHPEVEEDQRRGRALWWDRPVDLKQLELARNDTVPTDPYYYFEWHRSDIHPDEQVRQEVATGR